MSWAHIVGWDGKTPYPISPTPMPSKTRNPTPWTNQTKLLDADDDDANVDVAGRICQFAQLSLWALPNWGRWRWRWV